MADDQSKETESAKRAKRRLKGSSETVRERAQKRQEQADVPKTRGAISSFFNGFLWPLRQIGRGLAKLERFRLFRWIGYVLFPPYIRNSWRELKLVSWPGFKLTLQLTWAVILFSIIFGVLVAAVDFGFDKLFKELIVK